MATDSQKKRKFYKFSQIALMVITIPLLLMALFTAFVMFSSKNAGGYPSAFGYTVVYADDNKFGYEYGDSLMVKQIGQKSYKAGDIIAYYSDSDEENQLPIQFNPPTYQNIISTQSSGYETVTEEDVNVSGVRLVKVFDVGVMLDTSTNTKYYGYLISYDGTEPLINDKNNYVFADSVIGKVVDSSPAVISLLTYCASFDSFIFLVVIPCAFLLILQGITALVGGAYERESKLDTKQKIRKEELGKEEGGKTPKVNKYKENLAKTVEGFEPKRQAPVRPQRAVPQMATANAPKQSANPQQPIRTAPVRPTRPVRPQQSVQQPQTRQPQSQRPQVAQTQTQQVQTPQPVRRAPVRPQRPTKPQN